MAEREEDFRFQRNGKAEEYFSDKPDVGQKEVTIKWSWVKKLISFLKQGKENRRKRHIERINTKAEHKHRKMGS